MDALLKMKALVDLAPWNSDTENLIAVMHANPKWSDDVAAAWLEIVNLGDDAIKAACDMWVASGKAPHMNVPTVKMFYQLNKES